MEKLGEGGFGSVYKVKYKKDNSICAMKYINIKHMGKYFSVDLIQILCVAKNAEAMADLYKETTIQKSLKNKNIVEVYKAFEADGQLIIVMEYCSGGELKDHV